MGLYCVTCRHAVDLGNVTCGYCKNGFISKLACSRCNKLIPQGHAYCPNCTDSLVPTARPSSPAAGIAHVSGMPNLPFIPGLTPDRIIVPDTYQAGRFGADAMVQMNGRDAEILTKMNAAALMLHALAQEMNAFQDVSLSTREIIKKCRNLATDLQGEVEERRGPA